MKIKMKSKRSGRTGWFVIVLLFLSFFSQLCLAQQAKNKVSGVVNDAAGDPIAGVVVMIKGTSNGTVTASDGTFTLQVPDKTILVFSYLGFVPREISVGTQSFFKVKMEEDTKNLNEVVVVGYGTQRKSDVTTAVGSVSGDKLQEKGNVTFGEAMAGQVAGVLIQQNLGVPGGENLIIRVRGTGSITQSGDPLFVVDGFPMEGGAFRMLNTSDIESIQVLKDASSTAIYGSRGANGVIIVTTKTGKTGKPTIRLNASLGFQQPERKLQMLNRDQYVQWFIDGRNQAWLDAAIIPSDPNQSPHSINDPNSRRKLYSSSSTLYEIPDGTGGYKYNFKDPASVATMPDNNWQDLMFRNAPIQRYDLSVSGGTETTKYVFSGSYVKQMGILLATDYQRFNFRSDISTEITKRFRMGMSMKAYNALSNEQWNTGSNGKDAPLLYGLELPPIFPVRNDDGTYGSMTRNPEIFPGDTSNPIGMSDLCLNQRKRSGWIVNGYAELDILKDLRFRFSANGAVLDNTQKRFIPSNVDLDAARSPRVASAVNERWYNRDWVIENTLNYSHLFAQKHSINAMVGFTSEYHYYEHMYGESRTFATDIITTLNAGQMYQLTSDESANSLLSYLGRINYIYDNRYMLTATIRSDGSSRFGSKNKWGTFPSASVGWRVSQEEFMKGVTQISDLKLRASFGIAGNNRIGDYSSIGLLSLGFYPTGDALQNTVTPNTMPNLYLGWEKTRQINLGFELGAINNRVRLEGDFYDSRSINLLLNVQVPTITGYSNQMQNIGKVQNKGMEFTLNTQNLTGAFKWSSNFNISFNQNKVLEVGPGGQPIYASSPNANNAFITKPGYPIACYYGYVYMGVFKTKEELDQYPHLSVDKVGDGRYLDVDNNGKMDGNDKTILGNNIPKFTAGFSNDFSYKNFSFGIQFNGSYGAKIFAFFNRMINVYHGDRNVFSDQLGRWRSEEEPGDGIHFRPTRNPVGWQRDPSSAWVQDGSFLRLRNITLGYNFDSKLIERFNIKNVRLFVTGSNIYTWTKYSGYDPETSSEGSGLQRGGDYMGYPTARAFMLGANVSF